MCLLCTLSLNAGGGGASTCGREVKLLSMIILNKQVQQSRNNYTDCNYNGINSYSIIIPLLLIHTIRILPIKICMTE